MSASRKRRLNRHDRTRAGRMQSVRNAVRRSPSDDSPQPGTMPAIRGHIVRQDPRGRLSSAPLETSVSSTVTHHVPTLATVHLSRHPSTHQFVTVMTSCKQRRDIQSEKSHGNSRHESLLTGRRQGSSNGVMCMSENACGSRSLPRCRHVNGQYSFACANCLKFGEIFSVGGGRAADRRISRRSRAAVPKVCTKAALVTLSRRV